MTKLATINGWLLSASRPYIFPLDTIPIILDGSLPDVPEGEVPELEDNDDEKLVWLDGQEFDHDEDSQ